MGARAMGLNLILALRLGRVSNLPTVWTNVLAGAVLSAAVFSHAQLGLLILALSLFYVAGMYFNDAFDADYDARTRPNRPIPSGAVSKRTVFVAGGVMLAIAFVILAGLGLAGGEARLGGVLAGLGLTVAIVAYDAWHKGNPFSPVVMGLCRLLVYVTAALTLTSAPPKALFIAAATALSYLIGLTYAAKQEDLKKVGSLWPLIFLAAPFVYGLPIATRGGVGLVAYLALAAVVIYAVYLMIRPGPKAIGRVVAMLIAGICLLDSMFIAGAGQTLLAAFALVGFALTLGFQRFIPGT
ncbi:MAG: cyoE [Caulobacteraceae bacterium]|nr:cyoE [Caulobacteraceae bacterium]